MSLGFILNKHDAFQHQPFLVKITHASVSPVTTVQTNEINYKKSFNAQY